MAVGASAGGLDAFSQLLDRLPANLPIALVFIQHLSPQHESALPALLAAHTTMRVVQAAEGLQIEPGHVYVIPPNVQMGVEDGHLTLQARPFDRAQFTPIDIFFQSFARWAQSRSIGIVLSGTASDGAGGIREIKAAGGITIAQRPQTARYDGMPRAAISTGMVDLVLSPEEIAEHLMQVQAHPYLGTLPDMAGVASDEQLTDIFTLLRRVSGVDFKHYKPPTVRRRLLRRMALRRLTDVREYLRLLREEPAEVSLLYQDLLIHVTQFFRDPDSYSVLARHVFPEITRERVDDSPIRIWVPGCATGEEAYSVGIALMEFLGDQAGSRRVQIFATDVSESAIDHARAGNYPMSISADVSPERLKRFFVKADGAYRVNKSLRDACVFARHDLTRDPPFSRLDLIVCRNVLIYLDSPLQKRLVSVFHYALRNHGYLMLGPAETTGHQPLFTVVDKRWRVFRKAPVDTGLPVSFATERFGNLAAPHVTRDSMRGETRNVQDEANRLLLQRFSPVGVIIDANNQIVQFRGQTGPYLEPAAGDPNLNLLKMAREGLLFPLRNALQTARRKHRGVQKEHILVRRNGDWYPIAIDVIPLGGSAAGHLLVLFGDQGEPKRGRRGAKVRGKKAKGPSRSDADEQLAGLTRELAASREYLQSIIQELEAANEELQSANEEILSSNEELQSTNEELDTAKEELQSTNEELNTVNEELHSRNEELSRANSDLINLLATVDITILIVGDDMRIRRFTPMAERVLNLIPGDVGRPVGQINTNLVSENLELLTRETIDTMMPQEREVQDRHGRWYSLRVRPYKNVDNRIDGAVLTLLDISILKRYQMQLEVERARDHLAATVAVMREPVFVLDEELLVKLANRSLVERLGIDDNSVGVPLADFGRSRWNLHAMRDLFTNGLSAEPEVQSKPIVLRDASEATHNVRLHAHRVSFTDGTHWTIVVVKDEGDAA